MSRIDWQKAGRPKASTSIEDEAKSRKRDAASRWLKENDPAKKSGKRGGGKKKSQSKRRTPDAGHHIEAHEAPSTGVVIYTDGACEPNPGKGGWGFVVYRDGVETHTCIGGSRHSTNNIMEMTALLKAVCWANENAPNATIFTDSSYVEKGVNQWRFGWKQNNWRKSGKSGGSPVKNAELWQDIDLAMKGQAVITVKWCKAHVGIIGNERADQLSVEGMNTYKESAR